MAKRPSRGRRSAFGFAIQSLEPRLALHGSVSAATTADGPALGVERSAVVSIVDALDVTDVDATSAGDTSSRESADALRAQPEPRHRLQARGSSGPAVIRFGDATVSANQKVVALRVTFDSPVKVRGKPFIAFTLNGESRRLVYSGGAGGRVLTFAYKAGRREKPTTADVVVTSPAITLPLRAFIANKAGNAAASLSPPTDVSLTNANIQENNAVGAVIGLLSTSDGDIGRDAFTYTLVAGEGSADNAAFTIVGDSLCAGTAFDFEAYSSYSVRVRSTDQGGLSTERAFTITVANINETPSQVSISNATIADNVLQGATGGAPRTVGTLMASDQDANSTFTYLLVTGDGATDNAAFTIVGDQLKSAMVFNADVKDRYSIRVRATDGGGLSTEKQITIDVIKSTQMPSRGRPAETLSITGAFDPTRDYEVVIQTADGREIVVPPQAVTSSTVTFAVPLMFDPNTWTVGPAAVSVAMRMRPATTTQAIASKVVDTVRIRDAFLVDDLPSADAPLGSLAAVTLEDWISSVDRTIDLTRLIGTLTNGDIDTTEVLLFLREHRTLLETMYAAGDTLVEGVVEKVVVGQVGDMEVILTRDSIALIDRIIASQLLPPSNPISASEANNPFAIKSGASGANEATHAEEESVAPAQGGVATGPTRERLVAVYAKDRPYLKKTLEKWQSYSTAVGVSLGEVVRLIATADTGDWAAPMRLAAGGSGGALFYSVVGALGAVAVGAIEQIERQALGLDPREEGFADSTQMFLDKTRTVAVDVLVGAVQGKVSPRESVAVLSDGEGFTVNTSGGRVPLRLESGFRVTAAEAPGNPVAVIPNGAEQNGFRILWRAAQPAAVRAFTVQMFAANNLTQPAFMEWTVDENGTRTATRPVSKTEASAVESDLRLDIDGDGAVTSLTPNSQNTSDTFVVSGWPAFRVPPSFVDNGMSVPAISFGTLAFKAIMDLQYPDVWRLHDYLYSREARTIYPWLTREMVDAIMRQHLIDQGCSDFLATAIYLAVRRFGESHFERLSQESPSPGDWSFDALDDRFLDFADVGANAIFDSAATKPKDNSPTFGGTTITANIKLSSLCVDYGHCQ